MLRSTSSITLSEPREDLAAADISSHGPCDSKNIFTTEVEI